MYHTDSMKGSQTVDFLNVEGLQQVGEINSRAMREAQSADDYDNAWVAGSVWSLNETAKQLQAVIDAAGPYDDTRAVADMIIWIGDMIRLVHSSEHKELRNA